MVEEKGESVQVWVAKRRAMLVLRIVKGGTAVAEAARTHGLMVAGLLGPPHRRD